MRINPVSRQGLVPEGGQSLSEQIQIGQLHGSGKNQMETISRRNLVWLGKTAPWLEEEKGREQLLGSCPLKPISPWMVWVPLLVAWVTVMRSGCKETLGRVLGPWCQRGWL